MIAVDLAEGRLYATARSSTGWPPRTPTATGSSNMVELDRPDRPGPEPRRFHGEELRRRQARRRHDARGPRADPAPMVEDGKEAVGSMGDDTPLAVLSDGYRPCTTSSARTSARSPTRRSIRCASGVMTPEDPPGQPRQHPRRGRGPDRRLVLESPVLTTADVRADARLHRRQGAGGHRLHLPIPAGRRATPLRARSTASAPRPRTRVRGGATIVLTDEMSGPDRAPCR
jgi:glutamate synthase (NADPH/NADH) large chain